MKKIIAVLVLVMMPLITWAAEAGRIQFVTEDAVIISATGKSRLMQKDDVLQSGDRIESRSGRVQVRFTDGSLISLQPKSQFLVENYRYDTTKPKENTFLLSLLRGGLRTVTGAIAKINQQNYKVRTPVATIGVRGTEYVLAVDDNKTLLTVGSGLVDISNDMGTLLVSAGQSAEVKPNTAPSFTTEQAQARGSDPKGDKKKSQQDADTQNIAQDVRSGDRVNADGSPQILRDNTGTRLENATALISKNSDIFLADNMMVDFDKSGLLSFTQSGKSFNKGTLKTIDYTVNRGMVWGELSNGQADAKSDSSLFPNNLSNSQFSAFIMGNAVAPKGISGKATYELIGGTIPRVNNSSAATLNNLKLSINFDVETADLLMLITLANSDKININQKGLLLNHAETNFYLENISATSTGSFCSSIGCVASFKGFSTGENAGTLATAYRVASSNQADVLSGVAALGVNPALTLPSFANLQILSTKNTSTNTSSSDIFALNGLTAALNSSGGLMSVLNPVTSNEKQIFDSASLNFTQVGSANGIYWGEWTNGSSVNLGLSALPSQLSASDFQHYIIAPSAQTPVNNINVLKYSWAAGTNPRLNTTLGSMKQLDLAINLQSLTANLKMWLNVMNEDFLTVAYNKAFTNSNGVLSFSDLTTQSSGSTCTNICQAYLSAFLVNNPENSLAASYVINTNDLSSRISGVGVLNKDAQVKSLLSNARMFAVNPYHSVASYDNINNAIFDANAQLKELTVMNLSNTDSVPLCSSALCAFNAGTMSVVNSGHNADLWWGEWTNGLAYTEVPNLPSVLSSADYRAYIVASPATNIPQAGRLSFSLEGATPAREFQAGNIMDTGVLQSFSLNLNLFAARADVNFALKFGAKLITAAGVDLPLSSLTSTAAANGGFSVLTPVTSSNSYCSDSCSAQVFLNFAGDSARQVAAMYQVSSSASTFIGAAALTKTSSNMSTTQPLKTGDNYYLLAVDTKKGQLMAGQGTLGTMLYNEVPVSVSMSSAGTLLEAKASGASAPFLAAGQSSISDTGTDKTLTWGRFSGAQYTYDGQINTDTANRLTYIVGLPTDSSAWSNWNNNAASTTLIYKPTAAIQPIDSKGVFGTFNMMASQLTLTTGFNPSLDILLKATWNAQDYVATSTISNLSSPVFSSSLNVSCQTQNCSGSVQGFFSGAKADQAGLTYRIEQPSVTQGQTNNLAGAAIFSR